MPEITIGKTNIFLERRSVIFENQDKPESIFKLPTNAIDDLIDFLHSLNHKPVEERTAFRVAIPRLIDLAVTVTFNGKAWPVTPVDLSLSGILVEFSNPEEEKIPINAEIAVELRLGDQVSDLIGIVRRRQGDQYGILSVSYTHLTLPTN